MLGRHHSLFVGLLNTGSSMKLHACTPRMYEYCQYAMTTRTSTVLVSNGPSGGQIMLVPVMMRSLGPGHRTSTVLVATTVAVTHTETTCS